MRAPTVVVSAVIHVGLAAGLIAVAQNRELKRRAISVAVTSEKKKEAKPKPPPPPPPPPRVHRAAPKTVASLPKAEMAAHAPSRSVAAAPVQTGLTMSNADVGPGIGLGAPAPAARAAPAAVKVASAISERRTRRMQEEGAAAGDAPCNEEAKPPQPVFTTPIDYSLYPRAQQEGVEGKFRARLIVGADGDVTDVQVLAGIDPGFDAAIQAALRRWRFKPASVCGRAIAGGTHLVTARFELAD